MQRLGVLLDGLTEPNEIVKRLFAATYDSWFQDYAETTAMKVVTQLFSDAGRTWREAAFVNSRGNMIHGALQAEIDGPLGIAVNEQIQRNATYIKSVPADVARQFTEHILSSSMTGNRYEDIAKDLLKLYPHISDTKANLIARTETAKTTTALTRSRSELLGIEWYRWRTSEDERVRDSHKHMDKVLIAWTDPPSPERLINKRSVGHYHAGGIWNCRCYAEPIISLDFIEWPAKLYKYGKISSITRKQFEKQYMQTA